MDLELPVSRYSTHRSPPSRDSTGVLLGITQNRIRIYQDDVERIFDRRQVLQIAIATVSAFLDVSAYKWSEHPFLHLYLYI